MKTAIIYTSQTGFTKRYATWLSERVQGELFDLKEVQKKDDSFWAQYDAIVYAGWCMAGKIVKTNWFLERAVKWKDKRLAIIAVGAAPGEDVETQKVMDALLTDEQREYIKAFYCQGGLSYEKMNGPTKLVMKMFTNSIKNRKNATEREKAMGEMLSKSCDFTDIKFIDPIAGYLEESKVTSA